MTAPDFALEWVNREGVVMARGRGTRDRDGRFIVRSGALVSRQDAPSLSTSTKLERRRAVDEGLLVDGPSEVTWRLVDDREFSSSSHAARFLLGLSASGPQWWRPVQDKLEVDSTPTAQADTKSSSRQALSHEEVAEIERQIRERFSELSVHRATYDAAAEALEADLRKSLTFEADIPLQLSVRVKSFDSALKKVRKDWVEAREQDRPVRYHDVSSLPDVVGARIIVYRDPDLRDVRDRVTSMLEGGESGSGSIHYEPASVPEKWHIPEEVDLLDDEREHLGTQIQRLDHVQAAELRATGVGAFNDAADTPYFYYRGQHYRGVYVRSNPGGPDSRVPVEIQVTHIIDHICNELAHNTIYKPTNARPDDAGVEAFRALHRYLNSSRGFLKRVDATIKREAVDLPSAVPTSTETSGEAPVQEAPAPRHLMTQAASARLALGIGLNVESEFADASQSKLERVPTVLKWMIEHGSSDAYSDVDALGIRITQAMGGEQHLPVLARDLVARYNAIAQSRGWIGDGAGRGNARVLSTESDLDLLLVCVLSVCRQHDPAIIAQFPERPAGGRPTTLQDIVSAFLSVDIKEIQPMNGSS